MELKFELRSPDRDAVQQTLERPQNDPNQRHD